MVKKGINQIKTPDAHGFGFANRLRKLKHRHETLFGIFPVIAIAVTGFVLYANTLKSPFLFDDQAHITENAHIRMTEFALQPIADAAFESPLPERPVANISFALNYFFHQYNVTGYHLTNIAIHILSAIFLFLLLRNTLALPIFKDKFKHSQFLAFTAALLWMLHPVQTQAVSYIVQRMTSMAVMFYIMSIYFYVKGRLAYKSGRRGWPWFFGCVLAAILSFGCKEISATLPFFILFYDWFFFGDLKAVWLRKRLFFIIAAFAVFLILSLLYISPEPVRQIAVEHQRWGFSVGERIMTEFRVIIFYIGLLIFPSPARLNLDHDFIISTSLLNPPQTLISIIIILGLILSAFICAKKHRLISFCILWFFGNLFIESSFIGIELVYEHRLYLPSMFAVFAFVCLIWNFLKPNLLRAFVFILAASLLFAATFARNKVWADEVQLWQDSAAKSPDKPRPNYNLATALYERKDYPQAINYYNKTLQLDPNRPDTLTGLAFAYFSEGKITEAGYYADKAFAADSNSAEVYYIKGLILYHQNLVNQALANFLRAIEIKPSLKKIYNDIGVIYNRQRQFDKAYYYWDKAVRLKPDYPEALNNLAWLMATNADIKYRNVADSIRFAETANKITDYKEPDLLDTLAAAYANAGEFDKAATTAEKAVESATLGGNNKLSEAIKSRLRLYRLRQPFRETGGQSNADTSVKMEEKK
jgi:protein O-mannosyl-transferase